MFWFGKVFLFRDVWSYASGIWFRNTFCKHAKYKHFVDRTLRTRLDDSFILSWNGFPLESGIFFSKHFGGTFSQLIFVESSTILIWILFEAGARFSQNSRPRPSACPDYHEFWILHFLSFSRGPTQKSESGNRIQFSLRFQWKLYVFGFGEIALQFHCKSSAFFIVNHTSR